ncbi:TlyA family RNA methyltransferase [bacterium]|nr:TlyA family RNA methyltransferase [bacterium]
MKKERIDTLLVLKGLAETRAKAQALIIAGEVYVKTEKVQKASEKYLLDAEISVKERIPYVSRGAYKLLGAIDNFSIDVTGYRCIDIGASTGGFTDLLLQKGASFVYAMDVGTNQLDYKIRNNPNVLSMENTNARTFDFSTLQNIDFYTIDVSFISLTLIIPSFIDTMLPQASCVALIKPQFEVGKEVADRFKGVISDEKIQKESVDKIVNFIKELGGEIIGVIPSPISGVHGNQEFLIYFRKKL